MTTTPPQTLWEQVDEVNSGSRIMVRAASMPRGGETCGAVVLTVRVPADFFQVMDTDQSGTATLLLNPNEAAGLAAWLEQAASSAKQAGPPLYG
jgi:hypothetical protein